MISTNVNKTGFFILISYTSVLLSFSSCRSYSFLSNGTTISASNNYYLNDSLKLALYVPGDFNPYKKEIGKGVKVDALYPTDKKVLKILKIKKSQFEILFSSEPIIEP